MLSSAMLTLFLALSCALHQGMRGWLTGLYLRLQRIFAAYASASSRHGTTPNTAGLLHESEFLLMLQNTNFAASGGSDHDLVFASGHELEEVPIVCCCCSWWRQHAHQLGPDCREGHAGYSQGRHFA